MFTDRTRFSITVPLRREWYHLVKFPIRNNIALARNTNDAAKENILDSIISFDTSLSIYLGTVPYLSPHPISLPLVILLQVHDDTLLHILQIYDH